jgi:transcriptional antiterminator RfaH
MPLDPPPVQDESELLYAVMEIPPEVAIPDDLPGRWWVAHTKPRTEKALAHDLRAMGLSFYLPLRRRQTRSRQTRRISRSIVPVFSGYLFFNGTDEERYRALTTHRIANVLAVSAQGRLVAELRHLHRLLVAGMEFQLHPEIQVGQWARVIAGPLTGTEGIVAGRLSRMRLVLNVVMLGQSVSVGVDRDMLERIDRPAFAS